MEKTISSHFASRPHWSAEDIRHKIECSKIVVFSKGTIEQPRCGYSEQALHAVEDCGRPFEVVDVCSNPSIIAALRNVAGRKALPIVYVNGDLVANSDELHRMINSGELKQRVNAAFESESN